jgi:DNA-binding transcriptional LysR family regulator
MSHRLRVLRDALGDELLVRAAGQFVLTPRAESILPALSSALAALKSSLEPSSTFDASTAHYRLTLALPDLLMPFVPRLLGALAERAPFMDLSVRNVPPRLDDALASGVPQLAVAPVSFASPRIMTRALGAAHFGVVGRRGHSALKRGLTVERWLEAGHVVVRIDNDSPNMIERELARRRLTRRVALEVPSFLAGLSVVAHSDLLMNAPLELAREVAEDFAVSVRPAPLELPKVPLALLWHERYHADAAHRFAREVVLGVLAPLFGGALGTPTERKGRARRSGSQG